MAAPNTTIVLANYPKPQGGNHCITYANYAARRASVSSYSVFTSSNNYFVRPEAGTLKVGAPYEAVESANYGYFVNGNGRTYFFDIVRAVYVNDETTQIDFEIDVLATYYHDYTRTSQRVLREHVNDDTRGANIQPEPVGTGEMTTQWQTRTSSSQDGVGTSSYSFDLREPCVFIFAGDQPDGNQVYGGVLDGTVEGQKCAADRVFSVQYHPESAPGPQDSAYLFDEFIAMMEGK